MLIFKTKNYSSLLGFGVMRLPTTANGNIDEAQVKERKFLKNNRKIIEYFKEQKRLVNFRVGQKSAVSVKLLHEKKGLAEHNSARPLLYRL